MNVSKMMFLFGKMENRIKTEIQHPTCIAQEAQAGEILDF